MAIITRDTKEGSEFSGKIKRITEKRVYAFSGGFPKGPGWPSKNIHTDLEFAKSCGLQARNVSGTMFEGYLTEFMIDLFGESWLKEGRMNLTFIKMVNVGELLQPKAIVQSVKTEYSGFSIVMDVWCENQYGKKVVIGTTSGLVQ